jgi:hypothetical protein
MKWKVDKLEPGMVVARDVVNENGAVLLTTGTELSLQHLRSLKMWGIHSIDVAGEVGTETDNQTASKFSPELQQAAVARVDRRFRFVIAKSPAVTLIRDFAIQRVASQLASQSALASDSTP